MKGIPIPAMQQCDNCMKITSIDNLFLKNGKFLCPLCYPKEEGK